MIRAWLCVVLVVLAGCGQYPRDTHDSSARARDAMRVGVSHDPPFVVVEPDGPPHGSEIARIEAFAATRDLRIDWVVDGHERLMQALVDHRLHMVVGGHGEDSPWTDVSWSRPYHVRDARGHIAERRLALPPGENAWQLDVDRHLHATRRAAP